MLGSKKVTTSGKFIFTLMLMPMLMLMLMLFTLTLMPQGALLLTIKGPIKKVLTVSEGKLRLPSDPEEIF